MINEAFRLLAVRRGGRVDPGNWFTGPKLHFTAVGRTAVLGASARDVVAGRHQLPAIIASVDMAGVSPGALKIYQEGFGGTIAKLFGAQDITVGHRRFDALYIVKARPVTLAHAVFRKDRRDKVVASVRRIGAYMGMRIDLARDRLMVSFNDPMADESHLENAWQTTVEFTAYILEAAKRLPVLWDVADRTPGATCQVCGTSMIDHTVTCVKCRTPHHRECWDYVGMCSTFACQEWNFV